MLSKTSLLWALALVVIGLGACLAAVPTAWGQDSWKLLHIFTGEMELDEFGTSVSGAGDVNNDGYADLIVGAPYNEDAGTDTGRAYVLSGSDGEILYIFTGEAANDRFGSSVSGAGDLNNDGYDDLIVGASRNDAGGTDAGRAYVFSGLDGDTLYIFTGEAASNYLGWSVSGAGDVNDDGYDDLIVGSPYNSAGGSFAGRAYVFSGLDGDTLHVFSGQAAGDCLGSSVSGAGDVDRNGYDDLIVAALRAALDSGRVYVYSGQTGAPLWTFTGETNEDDFGYSVSGAGDVNGDGYDDLIVGEPKLDVLHLPHYPGWAHVYSGQTGALLWTFTGEAQNDVFGRSVSGAGDVNRDGHDDVAVGAPLNSPGAVAAGRTYVYSGQTGAPLFTLDGEAAYDHFGESVSGAGDVNNDGCPDLIVGAPRNDVGGDAAGRAYVYASRIYTVEIHAVSDVGNDQGKQVEMFWSSFPADDPLVTHFTVFRRVDSLLLGSFAGEPARFSSKDYPPGTWHMVATYPAYGETLYSAVVPTLKDSTIAEGIYWSVFFVRAGTDDPTLYYDSPVDSGYSLDNLSPSPPGGLIASHEPAITVLSWTATGDPDFDYYSIYRDTLSGFHPDVGNRLGYTIDTSFSDSDAPLGTTLYYLVSATDFSGNESDPSDEASAARYMAGDATSDGIIDVADIVYLVNYLYRGGSEPSPVESGDATCDGVVNVADIVFLVNYLYRGGDPPAC